MKTGLSKRSSTVGILVTMTALGVLLLGYTEGPVEGGGTISGVVSLEGTIPELSDHVVEDSTFHAVCGETVANEDVVTGPEGTLANVVVWIDGITAGVPIEQEHLVLDQVGCQYVPHVMAGTSGSQLTVTSSDETLHNTHGTQASRTVFNLAIPTADVAIERGLRRPGIIDVACDAGHVWMSAYVHVFEHPYFAVTGEDGAFELTDVPPGTYTLRAWHEGFGEQTAEVEVTASGVVTWNVAFSAE